MTPGAWHLARMLEALDTWPLNVALLGKGNTVSAEVDVGAIACRRFGFQAARGLGHDAGRHRRLPDRRRRRPGCRSPCTPTPSTRSGFVEDTARPRSTAAAIHAYHTEGAGGGHAPDIITVVSQPERAAQFDQPDPAAHRQHPRRAPRHADGVPPPQPERPRGSRVRREPDPAVDDRRRGSAARHRRDLDDRQRRAGDGTHRRGGAAHLADRARDEEAPRRAARATVRPTTTGSAATSRSTRSARRSRTASTTRSAPSRSASSPIWCCGSPAFFGVRPHAVIKGGMIAWAAMGDANASIPTPQPVLPRPMFGAAPAAAAAHVGALRRAPGHRGRPGRPARRQAPAGRRRRRPQGRARPRCRSTTRCPSIEVDPDTFTVRIDGEVWEEQPATELPMAQRYFLF